MLRRAELKILTALHDSPLGDINSLSRFVNMSPATFARNLLRLQSKGLLDKDGFVSAQIAHSAVGLELVSVFIECLPRNLPAIENMCEIHPYSAYKTRCFGSTNGVFALFAVPTGSVSSLISLLDALEKRKSFTSYRIHRLLNEQIYTEADFRFYDNRTGVWSFRWDEWEKLIGEPTEFELEECPPSVLHQMTTLDMKILKHLSMHARRERKEIAKEVNIPPYHLSRRLNFYRKNRIISAYRILFGLTSLNLVTPALVECFVDSQLKNRIAYAVSKLPFQGNFIPTDSGFVLYLTLPAPDFPKFAEVLLRNVDKGNLMWCDYASSVRYWFDSEETSNFREGRWLATREFLLDKVIGSLNLE